MITVLKSWQVSILQVTGSFSFHILRKFVLQQDRLANSDCSFNPQLDSTDQQMLETCLSYQ